MSSRKVNWRQFWMGFLLFVLSSCLWGGVVILSAIGPNPNRNTAPLGFLLVLPIIGVYGMVTGLGFFKLRPEDKRQLEPIVRTLMVLAGGAIGTLMVLGILTLVTFGIVTALRGSFNTMASSADSPSREVSFLASPTAQYTATPIPTSTSTLTSTPRPSPSVTNTPVGWKPSRTPTRTLTPRPTNTQRPPTPTPVDWYTQLQDWWDDYDANRITRLQLDEHFATVKGKKVHWIAQVSNVYSDGDVTLKMNSRQCLFCIVYLEGVPLEKARALSPMQVIEFDGEITLADAGVVAFSCHVKWLAFTQR